MTLFQAATAVVSWEFGKWLAQIVIKKVNEKKANNSHTS